MAMVIRIEWRELIVATAFWLAVTVAFWAFAVPWYIQRHFTAEAFVTNSRQDGEPRITIDSGPLTYGEDGTPRVRPDWLAHRDFRDFRTVYIYRGNALGPPACAPIDLPEPPGGYTDRKGGVQPEDGYSLDRWTAGLLSQCSLKPGAYQVVTEYRVPVLAGWFHVTFSFTSNVFDITP
jgi:hypothetical protein